MLKAIKSFSDSYMKNKYCQEIYAKAKIAEPGITNDMIEIASSLGNQMIDLEYALKEASHVEWKLEKNMQSSNSGSLEKEMDVINDLVRYTQLCPHEKLAESAIKTIDQLKEKGYQIYRIDNKFAYPHRQTGYRGLHILAFSPCGQKLELQFHSPISHEAKLKGHEIYKDVSLGRLSEEETNKAKEEAKKIHSSFPNPPGIKEIKSVDLIRTMTVSEYESTLSFPNTCILSYCSSNSDEIEIDGRIEDQNGETLSSYSEVTNYKEKNTLAVYSDNRGVKLFVTNPEVIENMIDNAIKDCELSLLPELQSCQDYINEKEEIQLQINEQEEELDR